MVRYHNKSNRKGYIISEWIANFMRKSVSALDFQSNCEPLSGEIQSPYEY